MKALVTEELRRAFRPEFLNRIDETVIFHSLGREHLRRIVDIQLGLLLKRLEERKITLVLTDGAKDLLAEVGYDPTYGARPLKRAVQRLVFDPLSRGILGGQFREGDTVLAHWEKGAEALTFTRSEAASAPRAKGKGGGKKKGRRPRGRGRGGRGLTETVPCRGGGGFPSVVRLRRRPGAAPGARGLVTRLRLKQRARVPSGPPRAPLRAFRRLAHLPSGHPLPPLLQFGPPRFPS